MSTDANTATDADGAEDTTGGAVTHTAVTPPRTRRRPRASDVRTGARTAAQRAAALRSALTAWLSRPLASFHLLLAIMGLLIVLGLTMVLSASSVLAVKDGESAYSPFVKQVAFVCIGGLLFYLGLRLPLGLVRRLAGLFVTACLVLLVLVLFTPKVNGAHGWIRFGGAGVQPVELAKLALALWGAHVLIYKRTVLHRYRDLLIPLVPVAVAMLGLVMLEPDLGSAVSLGIVLLSLLWFVGAPLRLFAAVTAGGIGGVLLLAVAAPYRLTRLMTFLNPGSDPRGAGLQYNQSMQALADGGLFGRGLGEGASKWGYLPNVNNDFIFALIGEELGFVGCLAVLGLFALLAWTGLRIAARSVDPWIRVVAGTLTVWLVSQAAINIGYVVGALPVTGVPLPLISSGGTSAAVTMAVFGLLANCARHEPAAVSALRSQGPGTFGALLRLPAPQPYKAPAKNTAPRPAGPPKATPRPGGQAAGYRRSPHRNTPRAPQRSPSAGRAAGRSPGGRR